MQRRRIGHLICMCRAVGCVKIHDDVGIVAGHHQLERACLGRVQFHKVPVEIVVLSVGALALASDGTVLRWPVAQADSFVAVGIKDRIDHQHHGIEPARMLSERYRAQQFEHRLLPFDLSGVDVALDVYSDFARCLNRFRAGILGADHHQGQRASFKGIAVGCQVDARRRGGQHVQEIDDILIAAGFRVIGPFGARLERTQRGRDLRRRRFAGILRRHGTEA